MFGVDIGGTFTDFARARANGHLVVSKMPTTLNDPALALLQGLASLTAPPDQEVVHGCTVSTNAVLEGKGTGTIQVATRGFAACWRSGARRASLSMTSRSVTRRSIRGATAGNPLMLVPPGRYHLPKK